MIINETTGEIAYHCIIINKNGDTKIEQKPLKNDKGKIKIVVPDKLKRFNWRFNFK